ncbi:uncharacterized protein LOC105193212 isoform X1 [Solenopsis invicta]|uniref:uncharacterized protein LOC105193212 isoform X1 n=1 Tax=Solenopsis invicta TaxID=13686 RepID=UPI00193DAFCA|nr:uncharacterized protein LOC105193212 isoform X1 [Solenopsis invicta]XP_039310313.1 uncharacterized protein LOC105193212 isoform X1 [Solenopsis invicta]
MATTQVKATLSFKIIHDPSNAIVQHQISKNIAKMLVMSARKELRLITFHIPNEDCTVQDLLDEVQAAFVQDKADIPFSDETEVIQTHFMVDDPVLDINYIVAVGDSGMITSSFDGSDSNYNTSQENVNTMSTDLFERTNASDENSNSSKTLEDILYLYAVYKKNKGNATKLNKTKKDSPSREQFKGKDTASKLKPIQEESD